MIQATDRERSLFLKGFKLSNSGKNEDPTYLGFKIMFDFGNLTVDPNYGWAPSPLLKRENYSIDNSSMAESINNPFGQPQYAASNPQLMYYSAYNYLLQREGSFDAENNRTKRANAILQFTKLLQEINANSPWFFQSIDGLDKLSQVSRSGFQTSNQFDAFDTQRTAEKYLNIKTLESINLRISALAELYNQATFDYDNMRWLVPRNLRKFTMWIFVTEIRNFFKTSRLINSSTTLTAIDSLSNLLQTNNNAGSSIGSGLSSLTSDPVGGSDSGRGNSFSSFTNNILGQSGISNDIAALSNQTDQLGIKPVMIYECQQCEFDFSETTPIKSTIDMGSSSAEPETNQFRIYVGKVRTKSQYPNIRGDGKPLILADGYDQNRSSLQDLGASDALSLEQLLGNAGQLLTNVVSNAVSDLVNEGIRSLSDRFLSGLDQSLLGNIYSFNPTQLARFTNESGKLGFNNLENFLNGAAETGIDNIFKGNLPNPQKMGQGGPTERVYPPVGGNSDSYPGVPGPDLGVPERVYPMVKADAYPNVPGSDLGVPDRVYPTVEDDLYSNVPGTDLGVPDRIYPEPKEDVYVNVPGFDLGVPDRVYPPPSGDAYENVPGQDLGVPDRVYPDFSDDVYPGVPGADLGVPDRVYPDFNDDVYSGVPGSDLGVPTREYPGLVDDVYSGVPGADLGVPSRDYESIKSDVYPDVPGADLGVPIRQYPSLDSDLYREVPGDDLGVPNRTYPVFNSTVYDNSPNQNTQAPNSLSNEFPSRLEDFSPKLEASKVYEQSTQIESRGELRNRENNFDQSPGNVYVDQNRQKKPQNLGNVFPLTSGDFIMESPLNLGNSKPSDKYNISLGDFNPDDYEV